MDALPPERRLFGDKDISKILKRASELQRAEPTQPDPSGLTQAELEEIAAEAGIDLGNVRRAVSELDAKPPSGFGAAYLGAPTNVRFERLIPGELTEEDFGRMMPILQSMADTGGPANVIGRTLTWTSPRPNSGGMLRVLVMTDNGATLVRVEESLGSLAGGLHGGLGGGGAGLGIAATAGIVDSGLVFPGIAAGVSVLAGAYLLARTIYKNVWKNRRRDLDSMFDRLVAFVEEAARQPVLGTGEASALPAPDQ